MSGVKINSKILNSVNNPIVGTLIAKSLQAVVKKIVTSAGGLLFQQDNLPIEINYVDKWPATCKKAKDTALSFWSRRVEGIVACGVSSSIVFGAWLLSAKSPKLASLFDITNRTTHACFSKTLDLNSAVTCTLLPSILGVGTTLVAGCSDLLHRKSERHSNLEKPIFSLEVRQNLDKFLKQTNVQKKNKSFLQNLLLYGPPGTGKTMIAKWIAQQSHLNYICMSGGDLVNSPNLAAFKQLMAHASSLESPTLIFIDEAEVFCPPRDQTGTTEFSGILNEFLTKTGEANSKVMFILATNHLNSVDSALKARMSYIVHIGHPGIDERRQMITNNVAIIFKHENDKKHFTADLINYLAKETEGYSGRDIFLFLNRLYGETGEGIKIDKDIIDTELQALSKQQKEVALNS